MTLRAAESTTHAVAGHDHHVNARQGLTLVAMCLAAAMTFLEITATVSSLTAIQADLHLSPTDLVWVASAYTLPVASLILTAGTLGGLFGRKRVLSIGIAVLVLGSLVVAAAPGLTMVLLGQAVAGIGGALILPNSVAMLSVTFTDPHKRTEAIALWAASSGVGLAAGPIIGGMLLGHLDWHTVFLTNVVLGVVALSVVVTVVTESRHPGQRLDLPGLVLATLAVVSVVFAAIEGGHRGYGDPLVIGGFVTFAAATAAFLLAEYRSSAPMLEVRLFRSPSFSAVMVVAAVALFGFTGVTLLLVLFFQRVQGLTALDTGVRLLPQMGAFVLTSAATGRLIRRTGYTMPLTVGLTLGATASLYLTTAEPTTGYWRVGVALAAFGIGIGLVVAASTAAAMTSTGPEHAPMASGLVNTFRQVGAVLGTSVLGTVLASQSAAALPAALAHHGVTGADQQHAILAAAGGVHRGIASAQVSAGTAEAFTTGLHAGLFVNAAVFALAALLAALVIRHQAHTGH
jgi:EmrB/QacA subfamily drug resistance transporter